jgi:pectate lyase
LFLLFGLSPLVSAAGAAAFPGATGFGAGTQGGRGGKVIAVTNLNNSGSGSFRAACEASGPRIIVFRTGGTIRLSSHVYIRNPYITIAGQTAPGGGITLRGAGLGILTNEVIVRGLRIRVGDDPSGPNPENRDALMMENGNGNLRRVVVDHCSFSWAIDETMSTWYAGCSDVTISNNIIAESLNNSLHPKGAHGKGLLVGMGSSNITVHGNLFAHNVERNPLIQGSKVEFINNVVYNRGKWDVHIASGSVAQHISILGNFFKKGPSAGTNPYPIFITDDRLIAGTKVHLKDNIGSSYTSGALYNSAKFISSTPSFTGSGISPRPASQVFSWVLANSGATPKKPDPVDARIIQQTRSGSGRIIDKVSEVGGWPTVAVGTPPVDSDGDGMSDSWETARGLNPNHAGDANSDRDNDGYTNIEEYINSFYDGETVNALLPPPSLRVVP